jgi:hypothetical protein
MASTGEHEPERADGMCRDTDLTPQCTLKGKAKAAVEPYLDNSAFRLEAMEAVIDTLLARQHSLACTLHSRLRVVMCVGAVVAIVCLYATTCCLLARAGSPDVRAGDTGFPSTCDAQDNPRPSLSVNEASEVVDFGPTTINELKEMVLQIIRVAQHDTAPSTCPHVNDMLQRMHTEMRGVFELFASYGRPQRDQFRQAVEDMPQPHLTACITAFEAFA